MSIEAHYSLFMLKSGAVRLMTCFWFKQRNTSQHPTILW